MLRICQTICSQKFLEDSQNREVSHEVLSPFAISAIYKLQQDGEFFCRVLMQAQCIKFSEAGGVYYRSGLAGSVSQGNSQSRAKAESLMKSYKSYERLLAIQESETIRKALGNNYLNFIYQISALYPDLTEEAEKSFYGLGLQKMWPVGGKIFRVLARASGFKNALILRKLLS